MVVAGAKPSQGASASENGSVVEILKRVRRIEIVASRLVNDLFAGEYQSAFRGRGIEFDEVREYQPGDEVRTIDWNVTARSGTPFVKRHKEERELTVLFLVDVSASGAFGSQEKSKLDLLVEVAALLMFSALKNNDKVGLLLYCDEVVRYLPPRKGKGNVLRFLRELISAKPIAKETRLEQALAFLNRVQKRRCVVFLLSDLFGEPCKKELAVANKRHDLIAVTVSDPRELALPPVGFLRLRDAETGEILELDTHHPKVRRLFSERAQEREDRLENTLRRAGVDRLAISTGEDYTKGLHRFFRRRERRYR